MNVTALVNASGAMVERYQYDPYGKVTILDGTTGCQTEWATDADQVSDVANDILYCGYRFDSETGLYHVRHRYYHPTLGRWASRDPIGGMVPAGMSDSLSLEAVITARSMVVGAIYGEVFETRERQMRWLVVGGFPQILRHARTIAHLEGELRELEDGLPSGDETWPAVSYSSGLNLCEYGRSRVVSVWDPTGLMELSWTDKILAKINDLPGIDYLECVCKCINGGNDKAAKFVEKHAKEAAAVAAAEVAAAALSTPLAKGGFVPPGGEPRTSLATKIAVRTGMGSTPTAFAAMRTLGRTGHYGVAVTAVGVGLSELGLELWCAYRCARDTNFRLEP